MAASRLSCLLSFVRSSLFEVEVKRLSSPILREASSLKSVRFLLSVQTSRSKCCLSAARKIKTEQNNPTVPSFSLNRSNVGWCPFPRSGSYYQHLISRVPLLEHLSPWCPIRTVFTCVPGTVWGSNVSQPGGVLYRVSGFKELKTVIPAPWSSQQHRFKSGSRKSKDSDDEDSDSEDERLDEDDYDAPVNFKQKKIHLKSLRADTVLSTGLDISRNQVDERFYGSRLRLNGEKLLKKSKRMDERDYVDLVMDRKTDDEPDYIRVKRVKILRISTERTNKDKIIASVKVWKSPFSIPDASKSDWKKTDQ